jgi:hypothetical protein
MRILIPGFIVVFQLLASLVAGQPNAGFFIQYEKNSVKIPVEIQHNLILIPLRINDSFEMRFILDSGVKTTILTEPVISHIINFDSVRPVRVRGLGDGESIDAVLAGDVHLSIPGATAPSSNLIIMPEGVMSYSGFFGKPVYGLIGFDLFKNFVVEINYGMKYIRLIKPEFYTPSRKYTTLPISIERGKPYIEAEMTDLEDHKTTANWLIDSGASQSLFIFHDELEPHGKTVPGYLGKGFSGEVLGLQGRIRQLQIGDFELKQVIVGYPESGSLNFLVEDESWYGNIGAGILSRFRVFLDYPGRQIHLRKNNSFENEFPYNISGIELIADGPSFNRYIISYVRPGSSAAQSGLQANDEILAINGFVPQNTDIESVYAALDKKAGRRLCIKVKREKEKKRFCFFLEDEI